MKVKKDLALIVLLILIASCGGNGQIKTVEDSTDNQNIPNNQEPPSVNKESDPSSNNTDPSQNNSDKTEVSGKANIEEVISEYPQGVLSFLSNKERRCVAEVSTTSGLKQMEEDVMNSGMILQEHYDYFTSCNIPPPPGIGIKEDNTSLVTAETFEDQDTSYSTSFASLENITSLGQEGVSPHLEKVDDKTLRLFYSSVEVGGVAVSLCDYEFNCEIQGALQMMSDLTIVETIEGVRRGYFVELNPQTNQKDIFTAVFSEDGLSYSDKKPLGFPVEKDAIAWGVPDAVLMPNGLVRVYWVYTEDRTSAEKIVSATSKTTKGIEFMMDPGYRLDNAYVDFEVIKAEEGDWKALMSYTPHYMPEIPQSLFYATSKDGLEWDLIEERITPEGYTYFDPTGIPIGDKTYLVVGSASPNVMGDREHVLFTAQLVLP